RHRGGALDLVRRDGVPRRQRRARLGHARDGRQHRRDQGGALMAISRRTFLIRGAEVGLGVAAVGLVGARIIDKRDSNPTLYDKGAFPTPGNPKVAVVKATSYDDGLQAVVKSGLASVGADVNGKTVLLKPNLVEFDAGTVINTDPRLVHATVLALRDMGAASVTVGEGPG